MAFHGSLQGTDGVDLGDDDLSTHAAEGSGAALTHVAITTNNSDLARNHDIGGTLDAVEQGFAATVEVVEFGLRDAVVHVDGREEQFASIGHFIETVNACGGLFGDSFEVFDDFVEDTRLLFGNPFEQVFDDLHFVVVARSLDPLVAVFHFIAFVDKQSHVATVINDELWAFVLREHDGLPGAIPVFFQRLAFPGKHRRAGGCDGGGGVVLSRENVA